MRFAVVGDTTLDVTVRGATPVPGEDREAEIQAGPGGQGANVAVRLARAGAAVRLVTAIGTDPAGRVLEAILAGEGVTVVNAGAASSGLVVSLVDASGERAMASDRISFDPDRIDAAVGEALAEADWLHVSGYPLADSLSGERLAVAVSRRGEVRCSIGGGSFRPGSVIRDRLRAARPDIVQFDRAEAAAILAESVEIDGLSAEALATELAEALACRCRGDRRSGRRRRRDWRRRGHGPRSSAQRSRRDRCRGRPRRIDPPQPGVALVATVAA